MVTYLAIFVVCDFDYIETVREGICFNLSKYVQSPTYTESGTPTYVEL